MTNKERYEDNIVVAVGNFNLETNSRKISDFIDWLDKEYDYKCNHNIPKEHEIIIGGDSYKAYKCQECGAIVSKQFDKEKCPKCNSNLYWKVEEN